MTPHGVVPTSGRVAADIRAILADLPVAASANDDVIAMRARVREETPRIWPTKAAVANVRDVRIPARHGSIGARLYRPPGEPAATIAFFHGGGFVAGDLDTHDGLCRSIAREAQALVLSVDYRRAPEHQFPAAHEDAYDATCWLASQSADRPIVAGDSAGATLAASVAVRAKEIGIPPLGGMVLVCPPLDPSCDTRSHRDLADAPRLTSSQMKSFWRAYLGDDSDPEPLAAPGLCRDLAGLPPALVLLASHDPLHDEGAAFGHRLTASGVDTQVATMPGSVHGFLRLQRCSAASAGLQAITAAIRRWTNALASGPRQTKETP